jgi:hypothetical protein
MKLLRMKPGHGEIVLAEGDVAVPEQEQELIEAFRRELDAGMWALRDADAQAAGYDPGRERRAEQRARALLRSCVDRYDWEMYRDLGFLRVWGGLGEHVRGEGPAYAYLIYPHKPIVAYVPQSGELLNEYCVAFPDHSKPYGSARLPHSDDVLAKWMALTADERRLIGEANMHLPGRQIDPERVRRDLLRMAGWERQRAQRAAGNVRAA